MPLGRRDESSQPGDEGQRGQFHRRGTVRPRLLEVQPHRSVGQDVQPVVGERVVVNSDGSGARTLVQVVCNHVAAPDGSRVYAIHDCDKNKYGTMDAIEVASGASTRLALGAGFWTLRPTNAAAVSSDGRWVTFMIGIPTDGGSSQYVRVVGGADGQVETLASQPGAYDAGFVSDRLLLFQPGACEPSKKNSCRASGFVQYSDIGHSEAR